MACAIPLGRIFSLPPSGPFIIWLIPLLLQDSAQTVSPNNPRTPLCVFQMHPHCHLSGSWGRELLQIRELVFSTEFPKYKSYCPEIVPGNVRWKVNMLETHLVNTSKTGLTHHIFHRLWYVDLTNSTTLSLILSPPNSSTFIKSFRFLPLTFPLIKNSLIHLDLT